MADYGYIPNQKRICDFLNKIQVIGIPAKINQKTLISLGFKSSNDRRLIPIFKNIGFISPNGIPTDRWKNYRNKGQASVVLAEAIKEHYSDLFETYPNANLSEDDIIKDFLSPTTSVGDATLTSIVKKFKALCKLADFKSSIPDSKHEKESSNAQIKKIVPKEVQKEKQGYTININIQLTMPSDAKKDTIDAFFKSMKKNLIE